MRRWLGIGACLWAVLGCSGMMEGMVDSIEDDPAAKASALKSFRESMIRECVKPIQNQAVPQEIATAVCGCVADKMIASNDLKTLMRKALSMDDPEVSKEMEGLVTACLAENGLGQP